ncbi:fungal-specific transcription factor domain-containing protein [Dactylonectria macrodidyma]|uniref:Fungal-specific transcription factor domain-containing protein n=1 Tax=Dactylonectria macrodidyma TaxID=307937 RepID=A0A9P9E358_9HYPO|nr:fungal-specific transcription factor domain-containing protein [Dactylonectria macrodidyma]
MATRHSKTYGACSTCKGRKVKCDQRKPACGDCTRLGLPCGGYTNNLLWIKYDPSGGEGSGVSKVAHNAVTSRRIFLSERERAAMSETMICSLAPSSIQQVLDELSNEVERTDAMSQTTVKGPFGVFQATHPGISLTTTSPGQLDQQIDDLPLEVQSSSHDELGMSETPLPFTLFMDCDFDSLINIEYEPLQLDRLILPTSQFSSPSPPAMLSPPKARDMQDLEMARINHLLENYQSDMSRLLPMSYNKKPPWQTLYLPSIRSTVGEFVLQGDAGAARASLLFSILAISAFNLDRLSGEAAQTSHWWQLGQTYKHRAKERVRQSLQNESTGRAKAKYKDVLMALLAMVTLCVMSGSLSEARFYLLDAEKFICMRGLSKKNISRKVTQLHNIYLYQRVIEESTFLYPSPPTYDLGQYQYLIQTCDMEFPSLTTQSLIKQTNTTMAPPVEYENLLSRSSTNPEIGCLTTREIYGIPQALLGLISQTTHLANELDFFSAKDNDCSFTEQLNKRSTQLENKICNWDGILRDVPIHSGVANEDNCLMMHHLVLALHSSLIIFYYRRVRKINPVILQSYVEQAFTHLLRCTEFSLQHDQTVAMVWPGFIAACEALSPDSQAKWLQWLREAGKRSNLRGFDVSADVAMEVWKNRKERNDITVSWVDVLRQRDIRLILT